MNSDPLAAPLRSFNVRSPCRSEPSRYTPLAHLRVGAARQESGSVDPPAPSPPPLHVGRAFAAAAYFRGGAGVSSSESDKDGSIHLRPVIAAAVEGVGIGGNSKETRLIIDHVRSSPHIVIGPRARIGESAKSHQLFAGHMARIYSWHFREQANILPPKVRPTSRSPSRYDVP